MNARKTMSLLISCALLGACASNLAPTGWLPGPLDAQSETHGGWISVMTPGGDRRGPFRPTWQGELLAVDAERIMVLTHTGVIHTIAYSDISQVALVAYSPELGKIAMWALLGALSTVPILPVLMDSESSLGSHGYGFLISAPIWLVAGLVSSYIHYRWVSINVTRANLQNLRAYARFPQGLPEGVNLEQIKPKQYR